MNKLILALLASLVSVSPLFSQFTDAHSIWNRRVCNIFPGTNQALVWDGSAACWSPGAAGGGAYLASFAGVTTLSVTAATHAQGTKIAGFCYDNSAPAQPIVLDAGFTPYGKVAANGDWTASWTGAGSKTGYCIISGLGSVGPIGATGPSGPVGNTGATGAAGAAGATGPAGSTGATGAAGTACIPTPQAVTSSVTTTVTVPYNCTLPNDQQAVPACTNTADGSIVQPSSAVPSTTQMVINLLPSATFNGFCGVVISGAQGPTGPAGPSGAPGGPTGATGATGSQGVQGATGATGPAGTGSPCTTTALALQFNSAGSFGCVPDLTFVSPHTTTLGASGIMDLSAASATVGFTVPRAAGAVPTTDGFFAFNTTLHAGVWGSNGSTIVGAAAGLGTTGSTACTNQVVTTISATAAPVCSSLTSSFLPLSSMGTITGGTWQGTTIAGGFGGTGNAFMQFSGPATSLKTYTLPNATTTILTTNAAVTAGQGGTGVANTATLTLGSSNQNWATLGTGIVKNTTSTGALTNAASADILATFSGTCNSSTFARGDGACATPAGTISGLTNTAIVAAASSTTIATPSATSTLDSSGNMNLAGTLTSVGVNTGLTYSGTPGTSGLWVCGEGTAPTGQVSTDIIYCDSSVHRMKGLDNNGSAFQYVHSGADINTSDQVTVTHLGSALPVNQGGSGTTSTLTGLMRGGSPMTAAELSGDATTSASNAVTVIKVNGTSVPTNAAADQFIGTTASATGAWASVPNCGDSSHALAYNTTTHAFSCQNVTGSAGSPSFPINPQTATYQVLAADFSACKVISAASGTFTATLVASGSQPSSGQCIWVLNYGSGVVTVARSGQNINGGTTSLTLPTGSATSPSAAFVVSDGTNYFAQVFGPSIGSTSVTVLGTVATGTWSATAIANTKGGTGGDSSGSTGIPHVAAGTWSYSAIVAADITSGTITATQLAASDLTTGTSKTFSLNSGYFECTGTCTITMPAPAAGKQFCIRNANNVATVITFAAIGSSASYENTASTAYGTAGTGTLISGGAVGDKMCLVGKDATHYDIWSFNGTWTAN